MEDKMAYGLKEVAKMISISVPFIRLEISRGRIKTTRAGRRVLITRPEIDRYLAAGGEQ